MLQAPSSGVGGVGASSGAAAPLGSRSSRRKSPARPLAPLVIGTLCVTACVLYSLHLLIVFFEPTGEAGGGGGGGGGLYRGGGNANDELDLGGTLGSLAADNRSMSMYSLMCDKQIDGMAFAPPFVSPRFGGGGGGGESVTPVNIAIVTLFTLHLTPRYSIRHGFDSTSYPPQYGSDIIEQARLSLENKLQYSHLHAYPFFYYHAGVAATNASGRAATWAKIPVLQRYLEVFDWLLWIDLDAHIMDMERTLESLLPDAKREPNVDLVLTSDWYGLNNGVFLIRRSAWSREYLRLVWEGYDKYDMQDATFAEQAVMERVLQLMSARTIEEHVKYVPRTLFNAYSRKIMPPEHIRLPPDFGRFHYEPGDFILHMPGLHPHERMRELRHYRQPNIGINYVPPPPKRPNAPPKTHVNWRIEILDYQTQLP